MKTQCRHSKRILLLIVMTIVAMTLSACGGKKDAEDITLKDVVEANQLEELIAKHDSLFIREDLVNINGYVENTSYCYFTMEEGALTGDVWQETGDHKMTMNVRESVIYGMVDEEMSAILIPQEEYESRVLQMNPLLPSMDAEELLSARELEGEIIVTTVRETFADGSPSLGAEYRLHPRTLRINSLQVITFNEKGQKTEIVGFTASYGGKEKPDRSAWKQISSPADGQMCEVTVIIEPGDGEPETRKLKVAKSCGVEVAGKSSYNLYSDQSCQILIPMADTTGDSITVYAKATN